MKILVGISGASGAQLGFCLLNALEKFTQKNDEIYGILSKGAGASFWAENLANCSQNSLNFSSNHSERAENSLNLALKNGKEIKNSAILNQGVENSLNLNLNHNERAENSKNSSQNSQFLLSNNEILALCKKKFNLKKTHFFDDENLAAAVSSGSFGIDKTIIAPCSLNTLAKIKAGFADTLILRAAAVALKERKTLVLGVREMPFSTLALKQMTRLSKMGVIIAPPVFASYFKAETLDDLQNFIVGKWLDLLGIQHELYKRWR